ncbi:hypothetical protein [Natrinema sp. HArc-T2]|uniref:hypothetical protein n=1 Tax=Natrinema sp. HArc-T2 TaxID=3242701 RepID=UPI00359CDC48
MGIKSGTITELCQEFYIETIFDQSKISTEFKHYCDSLLTDGSLPDRPLTVDNVGEFEGGWSFWKNLYSNEKENNFHFQPEFCIPSNSVEVPEWIMSRYDLVDYKVSPRVLYYPFGYFVVRIRIYFEFESEKTVKEFLNFERSIQESLKIVIGQKKQSIQSIFENINEFVFDDDVPEPYVGKNGDRKVSTISYLYEYSDVSKNDRARIMRRENREIPERIATTVAEPFLGYLEGDRISVDPEGAAIVTPTFDTLSERNRRWKRIHLLNNIYIAYDFALLERQHLKRIRDELSVLLDDFNRGTLFGNPIEPRYLVILEAIMDFGIHLRVTRGEVYEELEPIEMKDRVQPDIDDYIDRVVNHNSFLRNTSIGILKLVFRRT